MAKSRNPPLALTSLLEEMVEKFETMEKECADEESTDQQKYVPIIWMPPPVCPQDEDCKCDNCSCNNVSSCKNRKNCKRFSGENKSNGNKCCKCSFNSCCELSSLPSYKNRCAFACCDDPNCPTKCNPFCPKSCTPLSCGYPICAPCNNPLRTKLCGPCANYGVDVESSSLQKNNQNFNGIENINENENAEDSTNPNGGDKASNISTSNTNGCCCKEQQEKNPATLEGCGNCQCLNKRKKDFIVKLVPCGCGTKCPSAKEA